MNIIDILCELPAINVALYIDIMTAEFRFTFADSKNEFGKLLQKVGLLNTLHL